MENVSENKKRGRGRPAKHAAQDYKPFAPFRAKTPRGIQNYLCAGRAVPFLAQDLVRFGYLLTPVYRGTILAELGRIDHPMLIMSVASEICKMRMKTAKAIGLCKRMRGKGKPGHVKLCMVIERAIKKYCERFETVTPDDIRLALLSVADIHPG
jgi:hypothetical protein